MTDADSSTRPPQVTTAAWFIMVGSVLLVVAAYEAVAGLHTLDTRERFEAALARAPLSGTGLGVEDLRSITRLSAMVLGPSAAAAAILGFQVLRRDRLARLALTLLAVPLMLAGLFVDPILAPMVGAAIATLWVHPLREWLGSGGSSR